MRVYWVIPHTMKEKFEQKPSHTKNNIKCQQGGSQQIKKFLHSKENNQQNEETTYIMRKKSFSYGLGRGQMSRIYKKLNKFEPSKIKEPVKKNGQLK